MTGSANKCADQARCADGGRRKQQNGITRPGARRASPCRGTALHVEDMPLARCASACGLDSAPGESDQSGQYCPRSITQKPGTSRWRRACNLTQA